MDMMSTVTRGEEVQVTLPISDGSGRKWFKAYFMAFIGRTNLVQVRIPLGEVTKYVVVRRECVRRIRLVR